MLAISLLTKSSISNQDLQDANKALISYVKQFSKLYGPKTLTLNIHLLQHLELNVRKFGPLFTTSCFLFENLNGVIKNFVHSSKNPELQICSSFSTFFNYSYLKQKIKKKNSDVEKFCLETEKRAHIKTKLQKVYENLYIVGCYKKVNINQDMKNLFQQYNFENSEIHSFNKLLKNKIIFETDISAKNKAFDSS